MSNIHGTQQAGHATQLGPVTITKLWPFEAGKKYMNGSISDASGTAQFKCWGANATSGLYEGAVVTFTGNGPKGGIKNQEYPADSGKFALNMNECRIAVNTSGGATEEHVGYDAPTPTFQQPPAQPAYNPPPAQQYPTQPLAVAGDKLGQTMARAALGTRILVEELEKQGFTRDEALMLAQGSMDTYPKYWGGEKFMS